MSPEFTELPKQDSLDNAEICERKVHIFYSSFMCLFLCSLMLSLNTALAQEEIRCENVSLINTTADSLINTPCEIDAFVARYSSSTSFSLLDLSNNSDFTINKTLNLFSVDFSNSANASFVNNGTTQSDASNIINNGLMTNNATLNNQANSRILNKGSFTNNALVRSAGLFDNRGDIFNSANATINIRNFGIGRSGFNNFALVENDGTIIANNPIRNLRSGTINNLGIFRANDDLTNRGTIINSGVFEQEDSVDAGLTNHELFTNNNTVTAFRIVNHLEAELVNNATLNIIESRQLSLLEFSNTGLLTNNASINVEENSTLFNAGTLINNGAIDNKARISVTSLGIPTNGLFNSGLIDSSAQGRGSIEVVRGGALRSGGTITNNDVDIDSNSTLSAGIAGAGTLIFTNGVLDLRGTLEIDIMSSSLYDKVIGQKNSNVVLSDTTAFSFFFSDDYMPTNNDVFSFLSASMFTLEGFNNFDEFFASLNSRVNVTNLSAGYDWALQLISNTISLRVFAMDSGTPSDPNSVNTPSILTMFLLFILGLIYARRKQNP